MANRVIVVLRMRQRKRQKKRKPYVTTKRYGSIHKTTTAVGFRNYMRDYMRERRKQQKELEKILRIGKSEKK